MQAEMKVSEIIIELQKMPQDAEVWHVWDGSPRTRISHIWLSRGGSVVTADEGMPVYSESDRPESAPTFALNPYWETPKHDCVGSGDFCDICGDLK